MKILLRFTTLTFITLTTTGYCGTIYFIPQVNYGINILENTTIPITAYNILTLYNFDNSPFIVGMRLGYSSGTSDTLYYTDLASGINSYTRSSSNPYAGISAGVVFNLANNFQNMMLINIQNTIGATYNVNCQNNTPSCQSQTDNQISNFSFGFENDLLYNINKTFLVGINTGLLFSTITFTNYSSLNNTSYADAKNSTSTMPYLGLVFGYKF